MIDAFFDTDVIIDYLADRHPFAEQSEQLFALMEHRKLRGHVSSLTFSNLYYLLKQHMGHAKTLSALKELSGLLNILKVDEEMILAALDSDFKDFEDAIQFHCAAGYKRTELIVTRNVRDYRHATLPVMTPETLLKTITQ